MTVTVVAWASSYDTSVPVSVSVQDDGTTLSAVPQAPLPAGGYTAQYTVVALDGDVVTGTFPFGVATPVTADRSAAVQDDPDTSELHFALGNLFRRRGEFERAVRVHQHLLGRSDLPAGERERAQHALAQDFVKAGLFDRAEDAYKALEGTAWHTEARLALLNLYERSRDWRAAIDVAPAGSGGLDAGPDAATPHPSGRRACAR